MKFKGLAEGVDEMIEISSIHLRSELRPSRVKDAI